MEFTFQEFLSEEALFARSCTLFVQHLKLATQLKDGALQEVTPFIMEFRFVGFRTYRTWPCYSASTICPSVHLSTRPSVLPSSTNFRRYTARVSRRFSHIWINKPGLAPVASPCRIRRRRNDILQCVLSFLRYASETGEQTVLESMRDYLINTIQKTFEVGLQQAECLYGELLQCTRKKNLVRVCSFTCYHNDLI